jgi:glycosyltransferase involved in cell wall biosynthesis
MLTYERPGLLTATLESLRSASPDLHVVIYDDGSESQEKLQELLEVEDKGFHVNREPHRGLVRTWMKVFDDLSIALDVTVAEDEGIVLLEDDLLFAEGWEFTLLKMAQGAAMLGYKPGAMTCFRCHDEPQSQIVDLNGVNAYQSMQHGFQVNMVPAGIFKRMDVFEEAAKNSENGDHGIDIWFIGGLAHRLGLTSFMCEQSWIAHNGAGRSIAGGQGYASFKGVGYDLVHGLAGDVADGDGAQLF